MKPNFKSGVLFGENLMGCEMGKVKVEYTSLFGSSNIRS